MKKYMLTTLACAAALCAAAQSPRNIVIEETSGVKHSYNAEEVGALIFEEAPEYTEAPYHLSGVYEIVGEQGRYTVEVATCDAAPGEMPHEIGDVIAQITFNAPLSEDRYNAVLPAGYYSAGGTQLGYFDVERTTLWVRSAEGDEGVSARFVVSGSADVRVNEDGTYDLRLEFNDMTGEAINLRYEGDIEFSLHSNSADGFDKDLTVDFDAGQVRCYANWFYPMTDDMTMQFYTGEFDSYGSQTKGYWVNLPIYTPKLNDFKAEFTNIPDGVYEITERYGMNDGTYFPFTFEAGRKVELWGTEYTSGTYVTLIDDEGRQYLGLVKGGTLTVSNRGTSFEMDFILENGKNFKGIWDGTPAYGDYVDNSNMPLERPWSTLTGDQEMKVTDTMVAYYFKDINDPTVNGLNKYIVWLYDANSQTAEQIGDYCQFTLLTSNAGLADGTYTIAKEAKEGALLPGWMDLGSVPTLSWYSDFSDADADGYTEIAAPLVEGTMTVSGYNSEAGYGAIKCDFTDDKGNKITGDFDFVVILDGDAGYEAPARAPKMRKPARRPLKIRR